MAYTKEFVQECTQTIAGLPGEKARAVLLLLLGHMHGSEKVDGYVAFLEGLEFSLLEYKLD